MPHARITDPVTSHLAAQSVTNEQVTKTQQAILKILRNEPLSDEQIVTRYRAGFVAGEFGFASESGIRTRRAELVSKGLLKSVGITKTRANRATQLWGLV